MEVQAKVAFFPCLIPTYGHEVNSIDHPKATKFWASDIVTILKSGSVRTFLRKVLLLFKFLNSSCSYDSDPNTVALSHSIEKVNQGRVSKPAAIMLPQLSNALPGSEKFQRFRNSFLLPKNFISCA